MNAQFVIEYRENGSKIKNSYLELSDKPSYSRPSLIDDGVIAKSFWTISRIQPNKPF